MVRRWKGEEHLPMVDDKYTTILGFNEPYNHKEDPETIAYAWLKVSLENYECVGISMPLLYLSFIKS